ncbi:MAG: hypothetical protein GMKNLPBB_00880 [Myxococcota bacterium]|nr:hypothetical protein [Myxococcota bacterium]
MHMGSPSAYDTVIPPPMSANTPAQFPPPRFANKLNGAPANRSGRWMRRSIAIYLSLVAAIGLVAYFQQYRFFQVLCWIMEENDSCIDYARALRDGENGAGKDEKKALEVFMEVCTRQESQGCHWIGDAYEHGWGGAPKSDRLALVYYMRACKGFRPACERSEALYWKGVNSHKPDEVRFLVYSTHHCNAGDAAACARVGLMHLMGMARRVKDHQEAVRWFRKACDEGAGNGCYYLGQAHEKGWGGVTPNPGEARNLHRKSCAAGFRLACAAEQALQPKSPDP